MSNPLLEELGLEEAVECQWCESTLDTDTPYFERVKDVAVAHTCPICGLTNIIKNQQVYEVSQW